MVPWSQELRLEYIPAVTRPPIPSRKTVPHPPAVLGRATLPAGQNARTAVAVVAVVPPVATLDVGPDNRAFPRAGNWCGWVSFGNDPATGRRRRRHVQEPTEAAVTATVSGIERQREPGGGMGSSRRPTVSESVAAWRGAGGPGPPDHHQGIPAGCAPAVVDALGFPARPGDPCRHRSALPASPWRSPGAGDRRAPHRTAPSPPGSALPGAPGTWAATRCARCGSRPPRHPKRCHCRPTRHERCSPPPGAGTTQHAGLWPLPLGCARGRDARVALERRGPRRGAAHRAHTEVQYPAKVQLRHGQP